MATDIEKAKRMEELKESKLFKVIKVMSHIMDDWLIDPLLGLIPYVGDLATPILSLPYLYISIFKVKSPALTIALIYNVLLDCAVGLIPWIGNILDVFSKSYVENFKLLEGYISNDRKTINTVRRKVAYLIGMIVLLIAIIVALLILIGKLLIWLGETVYSWFV